MSKNVFMAIIILTFLFSLVAGMQTVMTAKAQGVPDAPMLIVQTPRDNTTFSVSSFLLNFTIMKPNSWDLTASGRIDYVDVALNGYEKFHDILSSDPLNGTGSWSKNYSISIDGLKLGTNTLTINIGATPTPNESQMTVGSKMYLIFLELPLSPTPSHTSSPSPIQQPTISLLSPLNDSLFNVSIEGVNYQLIYETNSTLSWVGYSINGANNVTATGNSTYVHDFDSSGYHTLTVYANDTSGNWATPQTVTYLVTFYPDYTPTTSPSPTQQPTIAPAQPTPPLCILVGVTPLPQIIGTIIVGVLVVVGVLFYFRTRRSP
jgi:hypothetical protein